MNRERCVSRITRGEGVEAGRPGGVQSVHRALDLLESLAELGGSAAIADLAGAAGVPLPTAHRLLGTLVDRGHVRRLADRRYALGFSLLPLAAGASATIGTGAERLLRPLVDALGETANLAVLDADHMVYVAQVPGRHAMRMFTEVGRRVDPHCTAVGKAVLAELPDDQARHVVERAGLERATVHTICDTTELEAALGEVRARGFAMDEEEQEVGVRCVAVAVPVTTVRLAVSVSGPAPRVSDELVARAVPLLHEVAAELAHGLE